MLGTFRSQMYLLRSGGQEAGDFTPDSSATNWSIPYLQYAAKMGWEVIVPSSLGGHYNPIYLTRGKVAQYLANAAGNTYSVDEAISYLLELDLADNVR